MTYNRNNLSLTRIKTREYLRYIFLILPFITITAASAATCTINGSSGLNFGNYNPFQPTPDDANGSVTIRCRRAGGSNSVSGFVDMYPGQAFPGGNCNAVRQMTNGTSIMDYDIYLNAARSQKWCWNGSNGTGWYSFNFPDVSPPVSRTYTAYGRIFALQTSVTPGTYSAVITTAVEFN